MRYLSLSHSRTHADLRRGALTVEFALVAPIVFLLFLGCLELTSMNLVRQTAGNAAYEASRAAIIPGASEATAKQVATDLIKAVCPAKNVTVGIVDDGTTVTTTVSVPVKDNAWGLGRFTGRLTIVKRCKLTREL